MCSLPNADPWSSGMPNRSDLPRDDASPQTVEPLRHLLANLAVARAHWRNGRRYGYPTCCVAHFCWDSLFGWPSGTVRTQQVAVEWRGEWPYVPCGIVHGGGSALSAGRRARGIVRHHWMTCGRGDGDGGFATRPDFVVHSGRQVFPPPLLQWPLQRRPCLNRLCPKAHWPDDAVKVPDSSDGYVTKVPSRVSVPDRSRSCCV